MRPFSLGEVVHPTRPSRRPACTAPPTSSCPPWTRSSRNATGSSSASPTAPTCAPATPPGVRRDLLVRAHEHARVTGVSTATDDAPSWCWPSAARSAASRVVRGVQGDHLRRLAVRAAGARARRSGRLWLTMAGTAPRRSTATVTGSHPPVPDRALRGDHPAAAAGLPAAAPAAHRDLRLGSQAVRGDPGPPGSPSPPKRLALLHEAWPGSRRPVRGRLRGRPAGRPSAQHSLHRRLHRARPAPAGSLPHPAAPGRVERTARPATSCPATSTGWPAHALLHPAACAVPLPAGVSGTLAHSLHRAPGHGAGRSGAGPAAHADGHYLKVLGNEAAEDLVAVALRAVAGVAASDVLMTSGPTRGTTPGRRRWGLGRPDRGRGRERPARRSRRGAGVRRRRGPERWRWPWRPSGRAGGVLFRPSERPLLLDDPHDDRQGPVLRRRQPRPGRAPHVLALELYAGRPPWSSLERAARRQEFVAGSAQDLEDAFYHAWTKAEPGRTVVNW